MQTIGRSCGSAAVGATWLHGKSDFEKYHTRLLNGRFHGMTLERCRSRSAFYARTSPLFIAAGRVPVIRTPTAQHANDGTAS
jgi:hypothetical protein